MDSSVSGDPELLQTERKLLAIGKRLQKLPKKNEALLALLEEVERVLWDVYMDPPKSTLEKVYPIAKALADDKLVRTKDPKIKLQLAACYNDLTRVTTPDGPYPYDLMKECFMFFLFAFKYLRGDSEKAYVKALRILDTMAELQTIEILTDLEDHQPILGIMFRRFFAVARFNQNPFVIKCMEIVMTSALQNTWEFSMDIIKPLLASVEKGNKNIAPASRELGRTVLEKNARKVRHWIKEAHVQIRFPVDNYDEIVSHLLLLADAPSSELPSEVSILLTEDDFSSCELENLPRGIYEPSDEEGDDSTSDIQSKTNPEEGLNNENKEDMRVRSKLGRRGNKKVMSIATSNGFCFEMVKAMQARFGKLAIEDNMITEKDEGKKTAAKAKGSKKKKKHKKGSASEKEKKSRQPSGKDLVNMRVKVWWPLDNTFYTGTILSYDALTKKHKVLYDDDEEEILDLNDEIWEPFHEERLLLDNRISSSSASSRGADQGSENVFECRLVSSSKSSCLHC